MRRNHPRFGFPLSSCNCQYLLSKVSRIQAYGFVGIEIIQNQRPDSMLSSVSFGYNAGLANSHLFRQAIVLLHKNCTILDLIGVSEKAKIAAGGGPGVAAEKRSVILQQAVKR